MPSSASSPDSLRPWQFFTLGALVCATVGVFLIRGTSAENLIFVCLGIFAAALVALAVLNALRPLTTGETRQPEMVGDRTRAAIEREKNLVLRAIKELEFDHAMGKVGEADFADMSARLRSRAVRLLRDLDNTSSGYRDLVERELARRLAAAGTGGRSEAPVEPQSESGDITKAAAGVCRSCSTVNDEDARFCKSCGTKLASLALFFVSLFLLPSTFFLTTVPAFAQFQMPDPKQMSGIARPVTDLEPGHVSVRLIRGQLSNNIQGHPVEMHAGGKVVTVKTDENGRAEFSGIAEGTTARAVATVDGERLESQEFAWPGDAGIRLMLVATAPGPAAAGPAAPVQTGNVVLGDQTRIIIDHADGALQVYYILDIRNSARAPVNPESPVTLEMPSGAQSATVLSGAPQAVAMGDHVAMTGPFQPGATQVQVAYGLPYDTGELSWDQQLPLPVGGVAVLMKKIGDMSLTSPQLPNVQEREFEGERYILAQGPPLAAGATLRLTVTGLPHHSPIPRRTAVGLALLIMGVFAWMAVRRPARASDAAHVKQLSNKRDKLFGELVRLEQDRRAGRLDPARYADRRPALIAQLERVYRDLDAEGGRDHAA